jgi:hypothetical protein
VERVVDIVQNIFKQSSASHIFEDTDLVDVPFAHQQAVLQSLLSNLNVEYKQGQAHINCQDLQLQMLFEFDKLKSKFLSLYERKNVTSKPFLKPD